MQTLELPLHNAKLMCKALLPHISKDDVTPALTGMHLGGDYGNFAYASDRYTVGRYDLSNLTTELPGEAMFIPRDAVAWLANMGNTMLLNDLFSSSYRVTIRTDDETHTCQVTVTWVVEGEEQPHLMRVFRTPKHRTSAPPMGKLFDGFKRGGDARVHVGPGHLDKFVALAKFTRSEMRITLGGGTDQSKLSPILIEVGPRFKGLLQPVRMDDNGYGHDLAPDAAPVDSTTDTEATNAEA